MIPEQTFPEHSKMAEDEALEACLENALLSLADGLETIDPIAMAEAENAAKEAIECFPNREEAKALMLLINFFKGDAK